MAVLVALLCGCGAGRERLWLAHVPFAASVSTRTLKADETWRGNVNVLGLVVVPRGTTLFVEPGTIVRFARLDADGDGMGDSGLLIEGAMSVEGTEAAPVRFLAEDPKTGTSAWRGISADRSRGVTMSFALVEDADVGIDADGSVLTMTRCIVRLCGEGIRAVHSAVDVSKCKIEGNEVGIRIDAAGAAFRLVDSDVAGNRTGIVVETAKERIEIARNRFFGNSIYDVRFGARQQAPVSFTNNYWETTDLAEIAKRIHDRVEDNTHGEALVSPLMTSRPPLLPIAGF